MYSKNFFNTKIQVIRRKKIQIKLQLNLYVFFLEKNRYIVIINFRVFKH